MSEVRRHFSGEPLHAGEQPIVHLSLEGLLPAGEMLAVHRGLGSASILTFNGHSPRMLAEQLFPPTEMAVLLPLVLSHPHYAPNELLLASFAGGTTEKDIETARIRLLRAKERGEWDMLLRPVRNVLSRVRQKIVTLHFDVRSIFETGVRSVLSKLHNRG